MPTPSKTQNYSRRIFLAQTAALFSLPLLSGCGNTPSNAQTSTNENTMSTVPTSITDLGEEKKPGDKTLVIYFSHSGNTRVIANQVHGLVGGDLVELKTVDPYPENYDKCVDQARKELDASFRPKTAFENLGDYDTIFLGYPNWWGTTPMAVATMLETYDFSGKTIIPFCTHEGSALGASTRDIAKWSPKSKLETGLAIRGRSVNSAKSDVEKWLRQLGKVK